MIDRELFRVYMAAMGDRIRHELKAPTQAVYQTILDAELTTAEFVAAMTLCIRDSQFFPSPAEIIAKAKPEQAPGLAAGDELSALSKAIRDAGGVQFVSRAVYDGLTDAGKRAFREVGGFSAIAGASEKEWPHLVRRWTEVWTGTTKHAAGVAEADETLAAVHERIGAVTKGSPRLIGEVIGQLPRGGRSA